MMLTCERLGKASSECAVPRNISYLGEDGQIVEKSQREHW